MKKGVSLYIAAPPFLVLLACYFIPYAFIPALTFTLSYFLAYGLISEELKEKARHRRYRYSFLRFLMGLLSIWDVVKRGQYLPLKRLMTPLLFSLFQVALMGTRFWYLPLCAVGGWALFEIYYQKFLAAKLAEITNQKDDRETVQEFPSEESASEAPQDFQNPQTDSEKNS